MTIWKTDASSSSEPAWTRALARCIGAVFEAGGGIGEDTGKSLGLLADERLHFPIRIPTGNQRQGLGSGLRKLEEGGEGFESVVGHLRFQRFIRDYGIKECCLKRSGGGRCFGDGDEEIANRFTGERPGKKILDELAKLSGVIRVQGCEDDFRSFALEAAMRADFVQSSVAFGKAEMMVGASAVRCFS